MDKTIDPVVLVLEYTYVIYTFRHVLCRPPILEEDFRENMRVFVFFITLSRSYHYNLKKGEVGPTFLHLRCVFFAP